MEARILRAALLAVCVCSLGANFRTTNFVVTAPTPQLARQLAESAEVYRRELAVSWLGRELPRWSGVCPVTVHVGPQHGAGGQTSFAFVNGQPKDFRMIIQGPRERLFDSVLPHEITHTIFATHFGRPVPRWADEGAATSVENVAETSKQDRWLLECLTTGRGIAFNRMFTMREYPDDVLPLYAQGYSVAKYLIARGGRQKFVQYLGDAMSAGDWNGATSRHYGHRDLSQLQVTWLDWVRRGSPAVDPVAAARVADNRPAATAPAATGVAAAPPDPEPIAGASWDAATNASGRDPRREPAPEKIVDSRGLSWYARQRPVGSAPGAASRADVAMATRPAARPRQPAPPQPIDHSLARPQGPQAPRQVVLEWSRPRPAVAAPPAPMMFERPNGTVWR